MANLMDRENILKTKASWGNFLPQNWGNCFYSNLRERNHAATLKLILENVHKMI